MASPIIEGRLVEAAINGLSPGSPLGSKGAAFSQASQQHNVDWRLLVAIAYAETELGRTGNAAAIHNPFGLGPGIRFNSWEDSIMRAAELIREYREDYNLTTVSAIGSRWAPVGAGNDPRNLNSNWTRNVTAALTRMGGNPSDVTRPDGGISTIPGDAAAAVQDTIGDPLQVLGGLVANLMDPAWWLRVGMVVGGMGSLAIGVVLIGRSVTDRDAAA
jgi:hypothetical protein